MCIIYTALSYLHEGLNREKLREALLYLQTELGLEAQEKVYREFIEAIRLDSESASKDHFSRLTRKYSVAVALRAILWHASPAPPPATICGRSSGTMRLVVTYANNSLEVISEDFCFEFDGSVSNGELMNDTFCQENLYGGFSSIPRSCSAVVSGQECETCRICSSFPFSGVSDRTYYSNRHCGNLGVGADLLSTKNCSEIASVADLHDALLSPCFVTDYTTDSPTMQPFETESPASPTSSQQTPPPADTYLSVYV